MQSRLVANCRIPLRIAAGNVFGVKYPPIGTLAYWEILIGPQIVPSAFSQVLSACYVSTKANYRSHPSWGHSRYGGLTLSLGSRFFENRSLVWIGPVITRAGYRESESLDFIALR